MKMTWFVSIAVLLLWFSPDGNNITYCQERFIERFIDTEIDYEPIDYPDGKFSDGLGECVDFVKERRPELRVGTNGKERRVHYAGNLINLARDEGYEVNELPRVGAVLVIPDTGEIYTSEDIDVPVGTRTGHVAIVTEVEELSDGVYTLTIGDANADGKVLDGTSSVEVRENITYSVHGANETPTINDPDRLREQGNVVFIHEKQSVYDGLVRTYDVMDDFKESKNKTEYIASRKGQFIETVKGIPKAFDDLQHGRLEGMLPQALYDVSTSLIQTIAAVTPAGFSLSLSDLEKMQKTLDSTRSVAKLDPGHPDFNVLATTLTSTTVATVAAEVVAAEVVAEVTTIGYYNPPNTSSYSSGGYYITTGGSGTYLSPELIGKRYGDLYSGIVTNSTIILGHSLGNSANSTQNNDGDAINNTNPVQGDDFFAAIYVNRTGLAYNDVTDFRNYFQTGANDPPHEDYDTLKWKYGVEP
jgi:surface antigen